MTPDIKNVVAAEVDMVAGLFNDYRVFVLPVTGYSRSGCLFTGTHFQK